MNQQENIETVLVTIDSVVVTIVVENINPTNDLYFAKCGYYHDGHAVICAGISHNKALAIDKCLSEFCERVALSFCRGEKKINFSRLIQQIYPDEFNLSEECIELRKYGEQKRWLIPTSLFNPRLAGIQRVIDGTGFAAHVDRDAATLHALCEIYERHCAGLFWDNSDSIKLQTVTNYYINSYLNDFFVKHCLQLQLYEIVINDNINLITCISILIDKDNHCYFGSAARPVFATALEAAILESIMMYLNIRTVWVGSVDSSGRVKELMDSYNRSDEYLKYVRSRIEGISGGTDSSTVSPHQFLPSLLKSLKEHFQEVYYKNIGMIYNRYVMKYIIPRAYIRQPLGFAISREERSVAKNELFYPFG